MDAVVNHLKLRDFRMLENTELQFHPQWNFFTGDNAQGKTSVLEAIAVLLRLQSPRTRRLADMIRFRAKGFLLDGYFEQRHLQFYYSPLRKKLALDSVEQKRGEAYLKIGRVVVMSNEDIQLVRGAADIRRRFLDFLGLQMHAGYRDCLQNYNRALRSRNRLLQQPGKSRRQIEAYNIPLIKAGDALRTMRGASVTALQPLFLKAMSHIAGSNGDSIGVHYHCGVEGDFARALARSREEEERTGWTVTGPHRDDLDFRIGMQPAVAFASEGQQRTLVLALKIAEAHLLTQTSGNPPVLLLDDIFGELDTSRRQAVFEALPPNGQRFVSSTSFSWVREFPGLFWRVNQGHLAIQ